MTPFRRPLSLVIGATQLNIDSSKWRPTTSITRTPPAVGRHLLNFFVSLTSTAQLVDGLFSRRAAMAVLIWLIHSFMSAAVSADR